MTNTTTARTAATFDAMTDNPDWGGFGYLGERRNAREYADYRTNGIAAADALVLTLTADWTDEELFDWANSKLGRWFADSTLGNGYTGGALPTYVTDLVVRIDA